MPTKYVSVTRVHKCMLKLPLEYCIWSKILGAELIQWFWNTIADSILVYDKQDGKTDAAQNLALTLVSTTHKPRPSATAHASVSKTRMCSLSVRLDRDQQKSSSERKTMPTFFCRYSNNLNFYYESKVMCNLCNRRNDNIIYPFTIDELRLRIYASNMIW